jgi:NAD(P)-dependent dehydrogenase (short-subunit alcohol dehydrogenase family)
VTPSPPRFAIVTGGSRGIGLATARALAARGDRVMLVARSEADLERATDDLRAAGADACHWAGDLAQADAAAAMVAHALEVSDGIDVCVMAAGIGHWGATREVSEDEWRETMAINLDAVFRITRAVLPSMIDRRRGHLVYVSSVLGRKGVANMAAYSASKAAVAAFGESVAAEVKPHGLKVTVIYPGTTDTGMREHQVRRPLSPDITDPDLQLAPEDVADAIAWATQVSDRAYPTALTLEPRGMAGEPTVAPRQPRT